MEALPPGGAGEGALYMHGASNPIRDGGCSVAQLATLPGDLANEWIKGAAQLGPVLLCQYRCNDPVAFGGGGGWGAQTKVEPLPPPHPDPESDLLGFMR